MSILQQVNRALVAHQQAVDRQVQQAREDPAFRTALMQKWQELQASIEPVTTPSGLQLPSLALPQTEEPGEIARFLYGEGMPGESRPAVSPAYPNQWALVDRPWFQEQLKPHRDRADAGLYQCD